MVRVTVRKRRQEWRVAIDSSVVGSRPTLREAKALAHAEARDHPARPAIEIQERPGVWRTVAP